MLSPRKLDRPTAMSDVVLDLCEVTYPIWPPQIALDTIPQHGDVSEGESPGPGTPEQVPRAIPDNSAKKRGYA